MNAGPELVLVRHGETEWTDRGLLHGRLDSPLSPTGRYHAELTGRILKGERFDVLYSSPQGRAMETAEILGQAVGLNVEALDGLREMHYGWLEGRPLSLFDPDGTGAGLFRPLVRIALALTGERPDQVAERVASTLRELAARHPQGRLLIVTHWGILSVLVAQLVDQDPAAWRNYGPWAACGITTLNTVNGSWQITRLNDHSHILQGRES